MKPGAESLTVVELCWQEDIFNIGADVNVVALSSGEAEVCSAVCGLSRLMEMSCGAGAIRWSTRLMLPRASQFNFAVDQAALSISIQSNCGSKRLSRRNGSVY